MHTVATQNAPNHLDEPTEITRLHWRMVITAGMGFFTDAYDLFIIGVVTAILKPIWHLSTGQLALLNGVALASAACGAILFGTMADRFGRKKLYGFEILILLIGSLLAASSQTFWGLLLSRMVVGFGIGGDYPSSAVVASEYAGRKNRGFLVLLVFAMQALGLIVGPLLASLLLYLQVPHEWTWRILLAFGAVPASIVFYLRRTLHETPQFMLSKKTTPFEVSRAISELTNHYDGNEAHSFEPQRLFSRQWLKYLIGTAGAWFLLDIAFYGNGVSSVLIINSLDPENSLVRHTLFSTLMFLVFAVPGYALAAKYVDKIGRKPLQFMGFFIMTLCFLSIAFIPAISQNLSLFILVFGLSFFFVNFGPNTTTFLIPSEIYPTAIRAQAHGFSAAIGKIGAFLGAFLLPPILLKWGLSTTLIIMAIVSVGGILTTFLVPEMKGASLDDADNLKIRPLKRT